MTAGSALLGLLDGLTIGLLAVGLVLVYKSNRFLNLAHAQMGTLSAMLLGKFVLDWHWGWWTAFGVAVPTGMATGFLVDRWVITPLRRRTRSTVSLLLATIGVTQVLLALTFIPALGPNNDRLRSMGYPLPFDPHWRVAGVVLGGQYVLILLLVPALVAALAAFLRYTRLGKMIRAAAANPEAARLSGISVRGVSTVTWVVAGGLAAVTAVLQAPAQASFDAPSLGPELLLLALGAAAFGRFVSVPATLVGGVLIGLIQQLTLAATADGGTAQIVVFAFILAVVLLRGRAIGAVFDTGGGAIVDDRPPTRVPSEVAGLWMVRRHRSLLYLSAAALAVLLPLVPILRPEGRRFHLVLVLIYALVAVSLTALIGWAGQVSLGHFAVVGIGAYIAARLADHSWSLPLLLIAAGVVGALVMVVVGLPALRVRGLTLALTTLGLAVVSAEWLFHQSWFGGPHPFGLEVPPLGLARGLGRPSSQLYVYYVALAVLALTAALCAGARRSLPGRAVLAVRDNEAASSSLGITPATVKLTILAFSGFIAGMAGVLWAETWSFVSPNQFTPDLSVSLLAIPVVGGIGSIAGSIAAAVVVFVPTFFASPLLSGLFGKFGHQVVFQLLLSGAGLVGTLLAYPTGIAGAAQRAWEAALVRRARSTLALSPEPQVGHDLLQVDAVHVDFGGIKALAGASIRVRVGEIVGLIGPNGAGKTTLLDVISGVLRSDSGVVMLDGQDQTGLAPEIRAAYGLGRTFQDARLFPGLTVTDVIQLAGAGRRGGLLSAAVRAPWAVSAEAASRHRAVELVDRFGLSPWADALTADLSTGTRRICDLAAQVAAGSRVLLLDEPTGGVAQREAEAFGPLLRRIRDENECAVVIVEHDMPLLMSVCDRVYAMEAGRVVAEGTPEEIRNDPVVIAGYLGTDATAIGRSGPLDPAPVAVPAGPGPLEDKESR